MYKKILVLSLTFLFLLSGCNWFSDNPMFPRAKINIAGTPIEEDTGKIAFEFVAVNKVGAQLTECHLKYKKPDGTELTTLSKTIGVQIDIIPPGTPMAENVIPSETSTTEDTESSFTKGGTKTSCTIDALPEDVEVYLKRNGIGVTRVGVTFSGTDFASHEVSYTGGEFIFNLLEGYEEGLDIEFFYIPTTGDCTSCPDGTTTSYNVGISLKVNDPLAIKKVEFYINGKYAGEATKAPFISKTASVADGSEVLGVAVVYDINGGINTISKTQKIGGETEEETENTPT